MWNNPSHSELHSFDSGNSRWCYHSLQSSRCACYVYYLTASTDQNLMLNYWGLFTLLCRFSCCLDCSCFWASEMKYRYCCPFANWFWYWESVAEQTIANCSNGLCWRLADRDYHAHVCQQYLSHGYCVLLLENFWIWLFPFLPDFPVLRADALSPCLSLPASLGNLCRITWHWTYINLFKE